MVLSDTKLKNGDKVKIEETPYYLTITLENRTWYWNKDTGKYDGTSCKVGN